MPVRFNQILAGHRAIDRLLAPSAAARCADFFLNPGAESSRFRSLTDGAWHVFSIGTEPEDRTMRTNLFIKVVVEHDKKELPEKLGGELCRQLERNYIVRKAELSSVAPAETSAEE
jgi:hypothetical protein